LNSNTDCIIRISVEGGIYGIHDDYPWYSLIIKTWQALFADRLTFGTEQFCIIGVEGRAIVLSTYELIQN
jgi:hypothetical protein